MIAFEILKNGNLLGTVEAGDQGLMMAVVQWSRYVDLQNRTIHENASSAASCSTVVEEQANKKLAEDIDIGDVITIRLFKTEDEGEEPKGSGVPIVRQPPELPPGRKLFSN
jgi:hypothetical protein